MINNVEGIYSKYVDSAKIIRDATLSGDYKRSNKEGKN